MGKVQLPDKATTSSYRNQDPSQNGSVSTPSVVPMHDYPDDEPPAYTDVPDIAHHDVDETSYHVQPTILGSSLSSDKTTIFTHDSQYSVSADELESMIRAQATYPPTYAIRLHGTHTETYRNNNDKIEKRNITDFDISLDMTHLLICPNQAHKQDANPSRTGESNGSNALLVGSADCHYLNIIANGQKGYRGKLFRSLQPSIPCDPGASTTDDLAAWCELFTTCTSTVKTFTLERKILTADTTLLESLARNLINSTSYRGHLKISFPTTNARIIVYNPNRINTLRTNTYIRWFFYLTFLWLISWPVLILLTKRYEPATAYFYYRHTKTGQPLVESEQAFFDSWKLSLKRAIFAHHQGFIDAAYRAETLYLAQNGDLSEELQRSQGSFLNSAIGGIVSIASGQPVQFGWGADT